MTPAMDQKTPRRPGGSFFDHLEVLRRMLLWGIAVYAVLFFPAWACVSGLLETQPQL